MRTTILLYTLILFSSCTKNTSIVKSYSFKLSYANDFKFSDNSFLNIDGKKLMHTEFLDSINNNDNLIPKEFFILTKGKKDFRERTNLIFVTIHLAKNLAKTGNYIFHSKPEILTRGIIHFSRKDKKKISISFSNNYPIILTKE